MKMAVRNSHSRQSSKYVSKEINGTTYMLEADTYLSKSIVYNFIKKAMSGKVDLDSTKRSIIVMAEGKFRQEVL